MIKPVLLLLTILALLHITTACRCSQPSIQTAYFQGSTQRFVKAIPVQTFTERRKRYYLLDIQTEYKACPELQRYVLASTSANGPCSAILTLNTPYVLALNKDSFFVNINQCKFVREFATLSSEESSFLQSRQICCNGTCTCVAANNLICLIAPCSLTDATCTDAVECVNNFCGGCLAERFDESGLPVCTA